MNDNDRDDSTGDSNHDAPASAERGRRGHLAVVDAGAGRAGAPTPSERQAICLSMLRRGDPPRGWIKARAAEWGISHATVSEEIEAARAMLEASRTPESAHVMAHEMIVQAAELGDAAQRLLATPLAAKGDDAAMTEAKAAALESRIRGLVSAASLKLKISSEIRGLYGLGKTGGRASRRNGRFDSAPHPGIDLRETPHDVGAALKKGR